MAGFADSRDMPRSTEPLFNSDRRRGSSWGPVFAGAVTAIGIQFVLTVLGVALGVSAGVRDSSSTAVATIGMAAGAWWLFTGAVSLALGGLVLGHLCGWARCAELYLHALALWGVVAIFGFLVLWSGAGMASSAASPLASLIGGEATRGQASMNAEVARRESAAESAEASLARLEEGRKAAQIASWWSVVGMLLGLGSAALGAATGASSEARFRAPRAARESLVTASVR